jgi:hypothetical protein
MSGLAGEITLLWMENIYLLQGSEFAAKSSYIDMSTDSPANSYKAVFSLEHRDFLRDLVKRAARCEVDANNQLFSILQSASVRRSLLQRLRSDGLSSDDMEEIYQDSMGNIYQMLARGNSPEFLRHT